MERIARTINLLAIEDSLASFGSQVSRLPGIAGDAAKKRLAKMTEKSIVDENLFISSEHYGEELEIPYRAQKSVAPKHFAR